MNKQVAKLAAVPMALGVMYGNAMAALPTGVETAVTAVETDGKTLVGLVAIAGAAVYLIAKVLGRFGFKL